MKDQKKLLEQRLNNFLSRNQKEKYPLKNSSALAHNFLQDFPEYKEIYEKENIASQIDCLLATQIL